MWSYAFRKYVVYMVKTSHSGPDKRWDVTVVTDRQTPGNVIELEPVKLNSHLFLCIARVSKLVWEAIP